MDYTDVRENLKNGKYDGFTETKPLVFPKGYVTDREKSVAWNEEQVEFSNGALVRWKGRRDDHNAKALNWFALDVVEAIIDDLGCDNAQAQVIYAEAWQEGHSSGYHEVITFADSYCDLIRRFLEAGKA